MQLTDLLSIAIYLVSTTIATCTTITVTTVNGPLIGEKITLQYDIPHQSAPVNLHRFLGIPYAEPPIGNLRFRRPVPLTRRWSGVHNATNWPNNCVQKEFLTNFYQNRNFTEDCLYLNVWSPNVNSAQKLPVLVWIHGGSFYYGGSSFDFYNGETLAALADTVVVTFNYRMSTLGFLTTDENLANGNQGLWDQVEALRWVQTSISNFGGDPKQVTIMGESAGSQSVSLHILSPVSKRLFSKAIMMSGSALFKVVSPRETMNAHFLTAISQAMPECSPAKRERSISKKVVDCLRKISPEKVDQVAHLMRNKIDYHEMVVVDGDFLPDEPKRLLLTGRHKRDLTLLASTVENEGAFFLVPSGHNSKFDWNSAEGITKNEAENYFLNFMTTEVLPKEKLPISREAVREFYFDKNTNTSSDALKKRVTVAYGDAYFACPTMEFTKALFQSSSDSVTVFQWHYCSKPLGQIKFCPLWTGACHAEDIPPMFGVPFRLHQSYADGDRLVSAEMIATVKAFLHTGSPQKLNWPPYKLSLLGELVASYYVIGANNVGINLKQRECDSLWKRFMW